ncbi:MAG TPA: hypothetical protein VMR75_01455 [Candidatus Saccharimonadales bacterium]|nr:hypothetical protein [Candidatus Saccharimonadales bacterium]
MTNYVWYPAGYNLAWTTSIPAVALIMTPVTLLLNANASFNILALLAPVLSATACFYLVHYVTKKFFPALVAGYVFGFSSYELGQLLGHLNLYLTFLIPLAILVFLLRIDRKLSKLAYIALLSVITVGLFGTSIEIFTTFAVFAGLSIIIFYLVLGKAERKAIKSTLRDSCWSFVISLAILSPYLYFLIRGYGLQPGVLNSPLIFSANLLNYVIPTPLTLIGSAHFSKISANFSGNFSETGAYLGIPLVLILAYYVIRSWRKNYVKALAAILVVLIISSLGPRLHVSGAAASIPLPWLLATHLPFLKFALPTRFTLYVSLVAAIMMGLWLSQEGSTSRTILKYLVALIAIVALLPNTSQYDWKTITVPPIFTKAVASRYIKQDEAIAVLPYGSDGSSMYYQYTSGMRFKQSGGYIGTAAAPFTEQFEQPGPNFTNELAAFCSKYKLTKIIYTRQTSPVLVKALSATGWPTENEGGVEVISVPSDRE